MAYSSTNPPAAIWPRIGSAPALWIYSSTHNSTDVATVSEFFTNGKALGMKVYDLVLIVTATTGSSGSSAFGAVSAVSTGATIASIAQSS